jgi:hypothetical protein
MTKQAALGIALGFSMIPATLLLIGPYAWATVHFGVKVNDFGTGAMLGIAALVFAVIFFLRRAG